MSIDNVQDISPRTQYVANAGQTSFTYPFPIFDSSDLVALVDGVTKALFTHYTVTGVEADTGGTVDFLTAMTGGEIVTLYRDMPIERTSDFQQNGPWTSAALNDELDRLTMVAQQLEAQFDRVPLAAVYDNVDMSIGDAADRANRLLGFDSEGNTFLMDSADIATVAAYGTANSDVFDGDGTTKTFTLSATPGALNNLDVSVDGAALVPNLDYTWTTPLSLVFDVAPANGQKILARYMQGLATGLSSSPPYYDTTAAEAAVSANPTAKTYPPGDPRRFGAVLDGATDDTTAITNTIASMNGRGVVTLPGVAKVTSTVTLPVGIRVIGLGYSSTNGTGAGNRGKSGFLRGFTGTSPTVLVTGDDAGVDLIDVDNNNQGTGPAIQVYGSRFVGGKFSVRNSGGDGLRIGKTNAGASDTNSNAWRCEYVIACGNAGAGMRLDDTNTSTSTSYPLGASNVNAGYCGLLDARSNGTDGLQIGNANDNVFGMVVSQSNTGCGIRFKTDGTNAGPRCNHILGNDCEGNTGNDIQIDAATLPASAPGLYNLVLGNRSVAVNSRIVDNSTGSLVIKWEQGLSQRGYQFGSDVNAANLSGAAGFNAYAGANLSPVRLYATASGASDSIAKIQVHKSGSGNVDVCEWNQNGVYRPYYDLGALTYSASMTIDASAGNIFEIAATNGTAFTINAPTNPQTGQRMVILVRNTSGGALGAVTWNAVFKLSAWTSPATGFSRSIQFYYNGTNWVQIGQTGVDVPN